MRSSRARRMKGGGSGILNTVGGAGGAAAMAPALKMVTGNVAAAGITQSFSAITYLFIFVILSLIIWILYLIQDSLRQSTKKPDVPSVITPANFANIPDGSSKTNGLGEFVTSYIVSSPGTKQDPFEDPYQPPLKNDGMYFPRDSSDIRGVPLINQPVLGATCNSGLCDAPLVAKGWPINLKTRGFAPEFSQIGILTHDRPDGKEKDNSLYDNQILPLFGRRIMNGRDKYQYYTMSNTGSINTKLPVLVRGKNCINEYGCDEIYNGDQVYVQGYNKSFYATIYENSLFSYIPFL